MASSDLEIHFLNCLLRLPSLGKTVSYLAIHIKLIFVDGLSSSLKYQSTMSVVSQADSVVLVTSAVLQAEVTSLFPGGYKLVI